MLAGTGPQEYNLRRASKGGAKAGWAEQIRAGASTSSPSLRKPGPYTTMRDAAVSSAANSTATTVGTLSYFGVNAFELSRNTLPRQFTDRVMLHFLPTCMPASRGIITAGRWRS